MKYCTKCGNQLPDDSKFCDRCGAPSPEPVRQPVQQPVYQPMQQPVFQPVQQPVYQPMQQPVYQQPYRKSPSRRSKWWIPVVAVAGVAALIVAGVLLVSGIVSMLSREENPVISDAEQEYVVDMLPGSVESQPVEDMMPESMETEPEEDVVWDSVSYQVLPQDCSYRNANGDVLVRIMYDLVVLDSVMPQSYEINALILADFENFIKGISYIYEDSPEAWEEMLAAQALPYDSLMCTATAEVVTNGGGIFSIRYSTEWFMGGVYNADHYCLTFNLYTGQGLELAELSALDEEAFAQQLREAVCAYLEPMRNELFGDPAEILSQYSLEDFQYYLENGEIVLEFPTYTFGPGYLGSTTVYTGIYAEAIRE